MYSCEKLLLEGILKEVGKTVYKQWYRAGKYQYMTLFEEKMELKDYIHMYIIHEYRKKYTKGR